MKMKRLVSTLLSMALVAGVLTGYGSTVVSASTDSEEIVTLTIALNNGNDYSKDENWPVEAFDDLNEALREYAGCEVEFTAYAADEFDLLLASDGEFADIMIVSDKSTVQNMIDGGKIVCLDDYKDIAPDIEAGNPERAELYRKILSDDEGGLYVTSANMGTNVSDLSSNFWIRWDWYKELGCPTIDGVDGFLDVVEQIVAAHPTTENGDKVYGFSTAGTRDKLRGYTYYGYAAAPNTTTFNDVYFYYGDQRDDKIHNVFVNTDSAVWAGVEFYFKANQRGLLDPDSFTMTTDDSKAKSATGQVVSPGGKYVAGDLYGNASEKDPDTLAGFVVAPVENIRYSITDFPSFMGWTGYLGCVNAKSPYIEQAVKVLNYLSTEDGSRMIFNGKEGRMWEYVDGVPTIKEEYIAYKGAGDAEGYKKTASLWKGFTAYSGATEHSDGGTMDLWEMPEYAALSLNAVEKDYAEYYGEYTPYQVILKMIEEGRADDYTWEHVKGIMTMEVAPDDIARIDANCFDIMTKAVPDLILAKDREEFESLREKTIQKMYDAGAQTSIDWYNEAWERAQALFE